MYGSGAGLRAGDLSGDPGSRIFDPYFSTKDKPEGGWGWPPSDGSSGATGGPSIWTASPATAPPSTCTSRRAGGGSRPLARIRWAGHHGGGARRVGLRVWWVGGRPPGTGAMERTLAPRLGHQAVTAGTAAEAVRIFRPGCRPPFDLLLTDVVLPDRPAPNSTGHWPGGLPRGLPVILMVGGLQRGGAGAEGGAGLEGGGVPPQAFSRPTPPPTESWKIVIYRGHGVQPGCRPPRRKDRLQEPAFMGGDPVGGGRGGKEKRPGAATLLRASLCTAKPPSGLTAPEGDPAEPTRPATRRDTRTRRGDHREPAAHLIRSRPSGSSRGLYSRRLRLNRERFPIRTHGSNTRFYGLQNAHRCAGNPAFCRGGGLPFGWAAPQYNRKKNPPPDSR